MVPVALGFLKRLEKEKIEWLTPDFRELPTVFFRFVHAAAMYFHASNQHLPLEFTNALSIHITSTKSHVGVLNYDNLLYDALTNAKILAGFTGGSLIDGFTICPLEKSGFITFSLDDAGRMSLLSG